MSLTVNVSLAPPPPVNCSSVPVYNEEGTLISINFSWAQADVSVQHVIINTQEINLTGSTTFEITYRFSDRHHVWMNCLTFSLLLKWQLSEEFTAGSTNNLDITNYTLSGDGFGTHRVPAQAVCQNKTVGTCSYSYQVQHFSLPNGAAYIGEMQVAAENPAGSGKMCSLQRPWTSGTNN